MLTATLILLAALIFLVATFAVDAKKEKKYEELLAKLW